jgi:hypothetical protein
MHYADLLDITKDRLQNHGYYPRHEYMHPMALKHVVPQVQRALEIDDVAGIERLGDTDAQRRFLTANHVRGVLHGLLVFGTFREESDEFRCLPWLVSPEIAGNRSVVWHGHTSREIVRLLSGYRAAERPMSLGIYAVSFDDSSTMIIAEGNFPPGHKEAVAYVAHDLGETAVRLLEKQLTTTPNIPH